MPQATDLNCFVCPADLMPPYMQTADERSVKYGLETKHYSWHESRIPEHKYLPSGKVEFRKQQV